MTRTAKALHPRALIHDRHASRNRRDNSMSKGGSQTWGTYDKRNHRVAIQDVDDDWEEAGFFNDDDNSTPVPARLTESEKSDKEWLAMLDMCLEMVARDANRQEQAEALVVRHNYAKNKGKGGRTIDLASIARTSSIASTSSSSSFSSVASSPEVGSNLSASYGSSQSSYYGRSN